MTVRQHLTDKANAWIASQLWRKINKELGRNEKELVDEHEKFPWIMNRVKELSKEYLNDEKT